MPVNLPTLKGKTPYEVERAILLLQEGLNVLEQRAGTDPALIKALRAEQDRQAAIIAQLVQQLGSALAEQRQQTGDGGGGGGGGGGGNPTVPLPNLGPDVAAYAAANPAELANSCLKFGGGSWDYMDGLVAALNAIDERVSFNGKRGDVNDPSQDAIAYYYGVLPPVAGSNDVYVVDVISCYCGPEESAGCFPGPSWNNVTLPNVAGAWLPVRP